MSSIKKISIIFLIINLIGCATAYDFHPLPNQKTATLQLAEKEDFTDNIDILISSINEVRGQEFPFIGTAPHGEKCTQLSSPAKAANYSASRPITIPADRTVFLNSAFQTSTGTMIYSCNTSLAFNPEAGKNIM